MAPCHGPQQVPKSETQPVGARGSKVGHRARAMQERHPTPPLAKIFHLPLSGPLAHAPSEGRSPCSPWPRSIGVTTPKATIKGDQVTLTSPSSPTARKRLHSNRRPWVPTFSSRHLSPCHSRCILFHLAILRPSSEKSSRPSLNRTLVASTPHITLFPPRRI